MCSGPQIAELINQLRTRASPSSSSSSSSSTERVFAHEDENLSIEPVLLAQCIAHSVSMSRDTCKDALAQHVQLHALQAAQDLKRLLTCARDMPVASVTHCGGAMRHPARCVRARDADDECRC